MTANEQCLLCLLERAVKRSQSLPEGARRIEYITRVMRIMSDHAGSEPAPCISHRMDGLLPEFFGDEDIFTPLKRKYNALLLGMADGIRARINASPDPLRTAMLYARAGNYIDFGTHAEVSDDTLFATLDRAGAEPLDDALYARLVRDLGSAERLLYLTDNCGEIVLDRLFMEKISERFPRVGITALVKGLPTLNDATAEDAREAGLDAVAAIVPNGSGIPGNWRPDMTDEARALLDGADVVISKGQANYETVSGCGLNVYYLLLCKCERFEQRFGVPRLTGLFVHEEQ